jgi:hypothetical protein
VIAGRYIVLPIGLRLKQNRDMEKETVPAATKPKSLVQWAITPPQSYVAYLVALFLVAGLSFYIGSLHPKKPTGLGPAPISAPRN